MSAVGGLGGGQHPQFGGSCSGQRAGPGARPADSPGSKCELKAKLGLKKDDDMARASSAAGIPGLTLRSGRPGPRPAPRHRPSGRRRCGARPARRPAERPPPQPQPRARGGHGCGAGRVRCGRGRRRRTRSLRPAGRGAAGLRGWCSPKTLAGARTGGGSLPGLGGARRRAEGGPGGWGARRRAGAGEEARRHGQGGQRDAGWETWRRGGGTEDGDTEAGGGPETRERARRHTRGWAPWHAGGIRKRAQGGPEARGGPRARGSGPGTRPAHAGFRGGSGSGPRALGAAPARGRGAGIFALATPACATPRRPGRRRRPPPPGSAQRRALGAGAAAPGTEGPSPPRRAILHRCGARCRGARGARAAGGGGG